MKNLGTQLNIYIAAFSISLLGLVVGVVIGVEIEEYKASIETELKLQDLDILDMPVPDEEDEEVSFDTVINPPAGWVTSKVNENGRYKRITYTKDGAVFYYSQSSSNPRGAYEMDQLTKEEITIDGHDAFKSIFKKQYGAEDYVVYSGFYREDLGIEFSFDLWNVGEDYNEIHQKFIDSFKLFEGINEMVAEIDNDGKIKTQNFWYQKYFMDEGVYKNEEVNVSFRFPSDLELTTYMNTGRLSSYEMAPGFIIDINVNNETNVNGFILDDVKFLFYFIKSVDNNIVTHTLYRVDLTTGEREILDTYENKDEQPVNIGLPYKDSNYLVHNWPTGSYVEGETLLNSRTPGTIRDYNTGEILYVSHCNSQFGSFFSDISPDSTMLIYRCSDGIYISDFETYTLLDFPESIGRAERVNFIDDKRIGFVDGSVELSGLLAPRYEMNLDGSALEEVGTSYMGW